MKGWSLNFVGFQALPFALGKFISSSSEDTAQATVITQCSAHKIFQIDILPIPLTCGLGQTCTVEVSIYAASSRSSAHSGGKANTDCHFRVIFTSVPFVFVDFTELLASLHQSQIIIFKVVFISFIFN